MLFLNVKKRALLQSASTILIIGSASAAVGQTVSTSTTAVTLASTDAKTVADQLNSGGTTATANDTNVKSGDGSAASGSSVSVDGSLTTATAINNTTSPSLKDSGAAATATTAAIAVEQDSTASATAQTGVAVDGTEVKLTAGDTTDSALTISGNLNRATATSNTASTSISDTDFTLNSTSATLAARQENLGVTDTGNISVSATVNDTDINLTAGITSGSGLKIGGNTDTATATGNSVTQQMTLDGTKLTLGTANATANTTPSADGADGSVSDLDATGEALVSSRQTNKFTDVSATNTASSVTLNAGATKGSSLDVITNVQDATAIGSTAGNTLTLTGTSVGTGAAIVSMQQNDSESAVTASTTGSAGITAATLSATTGDAGSSVSLTDNKLQSRATGGTVTNTLTGSATSITLQAPDTDAAAVISNSALTADTSLSGTVEGAYATLNDQLFAGDVSATTNAASAADAGYSVSVTGAMKNGSTINNDRNTLSAQAQAAVATNSTTLTVGGTLSEGSATTTSIANGAVIANIQELADGADVSAKVDTTADPAVLTKVGGVLDASSVSTSGNKVQAYADGAVATNAMIVSATTLNAVSGTTAAPGSSVTSTALTADTAFAIANRQDGGNATVKAELNDPVTIRTEIVGNASASSVASTGNFQDAFATSNKATNSLSLSATTISGDAGVVNAQNSDAQVSSLIGGNGATPTAGDVGQNAGVVVDFNGNVSNSAVAVTGNFVRGSAISNVGTNSLTVAATTLSGDGTPAQAIADSGSTTTTADYSLGNSQTLDANASSTTNVFATFGVDQAFDQSMSDSQVSVSNNTQFGEALGNSATNKVQLTATGAGASGTDPTAALNNVQSGSGADIDSKSEMALYSNMASSGSSIALNGNSNTALGVVNNSNNSVAVSATALGGATAKAAVDVDANTTTADYALNNNQTATGNLDSTAKTTAYNLDRTDTTTTGVLNGSVAMSKNSTTAEASANRVANSLAVSATDNAATAAIGNEQSSITAVNAFASSSSYRLELEASSGDPGTAYAASGSSVAMEGNTTTALARGNSASNALNYTVGVSYNGVLTDPTISGTTAASAAAVVLNSQSNNGNVGAEASGITYAVALNDGTTGSALNSAVNMGNNAVTAVAFGNSVNNSIAMSTFGAGIPSSAISNNQFNGGAVTAAASSVAFNMTPTGPASGSALRNSGNTVTAQAIGNSSVSTIGGGGM